MFDLVGWIYHILIGNYLINIRIHQFDEQCRSILKKFDGGESVKMTRADHEEFGL